MYKTRKWTSGWRWNNWYSGKQSLFDAKLDSKLSSWFLHVSTPLTKVTSESKNKRQIAVVYRYCNLSRFFWLRCYICLPRDFSFVRLLYYQSFEITNQSLHIDVIEKNYVLLSIKIGCTWFDAEVNWQFYPVSTNSNICSCGSMYYIMLVQICPTQIFSFHTLCPLQLVSK